MQKQIQATPGTSGTNETLKGDAKAKLAANKGLAALDAIDQALAQEVEQEQEQEQESSSCRCW